MKLVGWILLAAVLLRGWAGLAYGIYYEFGLEWAFFFMGVGVVLLSAGVTSLIVRYQKNPL